MHYLVYKITNLLNDKSYIGCHKTENKDDGYMGSGVALKPQLKNLDFKISRKTVLSNEVSMEATI